MESGTIAMGWDALPDLAPVETMEDLARIVRAAYPSEKNDALKNWQNQVWAFLSRMKVGDLVVLPFRDRPQVAVGRSGHTLLSPSRSRTCGRRSRC